MGDASSQRSGLRCPVCRAGFRGSAQCSRCGADLSTLMRLVGRAWRMRDQAEALLQRRKYAFALTAAEASVTFHSTARGRRLACVAGLLRAAARREAE